MLLHEEEEDEDEGEESVNLYFIPHVTFSFKCMHHPYLKNLLISFLFFNSIMKLVHVHTMSCRLSIVNSW